MTPPPSRHDRSRSDTANRTPETVAEPILAMGFMVLFLALVAVWSAGGFWAALLVGLGAERALALFADPSG